MILVGHTITLYFSTRENRRPWTGNDVATSFMVDTSCAPVIAYAALLPFPYLFRIKLHIGVNQVAVGEVF